MTDGADDDKDAKPRAADPPATRKHEKAVPDGHDHALDAPPSAAPPPLDAPITYPDDGPLSAALRKLDARIGLGEQVVLVALLAVVVLTAATHALLDRIAHIQLEFKGEVVHAGTFAIAILGTVFATQQARHLAMDLVSRRLSPTKRLYLKILLAVFTAFIVVMLVHAGLHTIDIEKQMQSHELIPGVWIAWLIPIGGVLILVHLFLHTVIDIDYLRRGKTPPERMRSGH